MEKKRQNYLNINDVSNLLKVSKHTVQAWVSPSSPNHKSEFALLARHAGRRTLFLEDDVLNWLNQRRGPLYAQKINERSPYWKDLLLETRGLFKNSIALPNETKKLSKRKFNGGSIGFDTEPLLIWLTDHQKASDIKKIIIKADTIILPITLCNKILRQTKKNKKVFEKMKSFLLEQRIFELADFNERALALTETLPTGLSESNTINYASSIANGADFFLTRNIGLSNIKSLPLVVI